MTDRSGHYVTLEFILTEYRPGSQPLGSWSWDDEERDIFQRTCCCRSHECANPIDVPEGHYQKMLEAYILANGIPGRICLGTDGRVWDGNHRVVAARRLSIHWVPVEPAALEAVK